MAKIKTWETLDDIPGFKFSNIMQFIQNAGENSVTLQDITVILTSIFDKVNQASMTFK